MTLQSSILCLQDGKGVVNEDQAKLLLCRGGEKLSDEQCEDIFRLTQCKVRGGIDYRSEYTASTPQVHNEYTIIEPRVHHECIMSVS